MTAPTSEAAAPPDPAQPVSPPIAKKRRWPLYILTAIVLIAIYNLIGLYSVPPIGALPEGATVVIWRFNWNSQFIDSPDAQCLRVQGNVSLLCRAVALGQLKPGWIILRLPYQDWAYSISTGGNSTTAKPVAPGGSSGSSTHVVLYIVKGTARSASLTYENEQGGTEQKDVTLPWQTRLTPDTGAFVYLSAQNKGGSGSIICEIWVDGFLYKTSTSSGAYKIASCDGTVGG